MAAPSLGSEYAIAGRARELVFERSPIYVKHFVRNGLRGLLREHHDVGSKAVPGVDHEFEPTAAARQLIDVPRNRKLAGLIQTRDSLQPIRDVAIAHFALPFYCEFSHYESLSVKKRRIGTQLWWCFNFLRVKHHEKISFPSTDLGPPNNAAPQGRKSSNPLKLSGQAEPRYLTKIPQLLAQGECSLLYTVLFHTEPFL